MSVHDSPGQFLTFPDAEKSPLSIRAKALVFIDPRSRQLRADMERLAAGPLPILIRGETGTGKELLARHIHRGSDRGGLFVSVNCGALSPTYAEAELFGHAPGAHGVSASSRAGWFGSANGGTLYLDEIGDLPLAVQAKLLAALENREVTRVGAQQASPVDVRLVAATSIDLSQAVAAGRFHERLFQYLSDGRLDLPALREQPGNILPLAEYFIGIYSQRLGLPLPLLSLAAQQLLLAHPWPGNTRELENVIHFALLLNGGDEILPEHLNLPAAPDPLAEIRRQAAVLLEAGGPAEQAHLKSLLSELSARLSLF
ncbi:sigma 54-interacting transcriptional regulator [Pseudomonas sp. DTU_2021_1001937_2_SI_NGA_ILE_001]|uniref:sigma 54-interacting transcriptional regulator n=1 Tax=Pseudomonas sp. DTU_2021_1001937_2_SI_NGA_ILE_001 TaxID=3077589 RepID=UPI0028FC27E8|nr:sigma 54-interacting transcriptional regulator [Pseudomonas sp. DTU_2021_1001937_2_SI_NGA_ILE_001]WNW12888.1 sigma 54-interacting transcriptional regulator [Pseudomonas sp. DTU_2021_1001937_2_SI_NGA_ILE_001]